MSEDTSQATFVERHGLRTTDQARRARDLAARVELDGLHLVRLIWADPHGAARAKAVSIPVFKDALAGGYNINVATSTLDSANGRVFASFTAGGGMGLAEMTGSPNLVIVADPDTFRVLPWAPGVGWLICDEYFQDGRPFHFSPRHLLRRMIGELAGDGLRMVIGLEIEWYLARVVQERLTDANIGAPGMRGRPIETAPVEPGFSYHSESNLDLMQPLLSELALAYGKLGLNLRSMENEWGPGQVECTFAPSDALRAADDYLLMRTATRQICRRAGYFASFMCKPGLAGHYASGWHLHQSLIDGDGKNIFAGGGGDSNAAEGGSASGLGAKENSGLGAKKSSGGDSSSASNAAEGGSAGGLDANKNSGLGANKNSSDLSVLGQNYLGGLLEHAVAGTVFATPTVNGYRRFTPNSLAPDRAGWGIDHRGAMLRLIGRGGEPATRIENRVGEPAANPYLFIAAQIAAGRDGLARRLDPGAPDDAPYGAERPLLPADLGAALAALGGSALYRAAFGDLFIDYYLKLKGAEFERFEQYSAANKGDTQPGAVTQWEHNEYYDFF